MLNDNKSKIKEIQKGLKRKLEYWMIAFKTPREKVGSWDNEMVLTCI